MNRYASTFISGLQDVVGDLFRALYPDVEILLLLDGLIVYQGNLSVQEVQRLRFVTNSFIVLDRFDNLGKDPVQRMLALAARDGDLEGKVAAGAKAARVGRTFRIVVSHENRFVAAPQDLLESLERRIAGVSGLRVNRAKPDAEFWFYVRRECGGPPHGFFLLRLTSHTAYEKILQKGELKPELAHLLCFLSEPAAEDIFLDPFCGYGAIPLERARAFPCNMIFAIDKDPAKKRFVRERLKAVKFAPLGTGAPSKGGGAPTFIVKTEDALNLTSFDANFVHKIVTDPPWGLFEQLEMPPGAFYARMLAELCRVLRPGGVMVILMGRTDARGTVDFERALAGLGERLWLAGKYDILVSGKKATIYKLIKSAHANKPPRTPSSPSKSG